jgi:hypothetical protein
MISPHRIEIDPFLCSSPNKMVYVLHILKPKIQNSYYICIIIYHYYCIHLTASSRISYLPHVIISPVFLRPRLPCIHYHLNCDIFADVYTPNVQCSTIFASCVCTSALCLIVIITHHHTIDPILSFITH